MTDSDRSEMSDRPTAPTVAALASAPLSVSAPGKPVSEILVVDDDPGCRNLLIRVFGAHGWQVIAAADGDEAIEKAQGKNIDVVVLDLLMPKRSGLDTLSALRSIDPQIEVIMVTGDATVGSAIQSMKLGAYDYITKPLQIDNLIRIVDRALEKRRLSRKVDELNDICRFKSELLDNMGHELRTPMNAILGYTALHLDRVYGEITPKQEQSLKRVEAAGNNLLEVINSILDNSKLSAGRMPVYLENFSLKELSREILDMMEILAQAKGLKLEWNMAEDLRLRSDKTKVKQIMVNLITNAIKFTRMGGVFIEAKQAPESGRVQIRVRDTGIGIKAEDIKLLFQEFRQLDVSSTREFGGTGLGLVISKKFAELLGGTIEVESVEGSGTVFTVALPLESAKEKDETATIFNMTSSCKPNKTLLAIDDDPEILNLLRDSLHGTGYGFAGALAGEEGIALARQIKPLAITLDVMMPRRDGWAVLQILKSDPELRSIPVIMVSLLDNRSLGYALGVTDYLIKPFKRVELLEKLNTIEGDRRSPASAPKDVSMDPFRGR